VVRYVAARAARLSSLTDDGRKQGRGGVEVRPIHEGIASCGMGVVVVHNLGESLSLVVVAPELVGVFG